MDLLSASAVFATTKRLLRAQMTLKGVNAAGLAERLTAMGIQETEKNVANKIARWILGGLPSPMHVSSRRSNPALRGLAVLVITCALCAGAAAAQRVPLQESDAGKQAQTEQHEATEERPPPLPEDAQNEQPSPAYRPDCSNPPDHDSADYCQQERMALAAEAGVDAGWAAARATREQNWLLWITVMLSFGAAIASAVSAWAAHRALTGLERPYLMLRYASVDWTKPTFSSEAKRGKPSERWQELCLHFHYDVKNYGRSPCTVRGVNFLYIQREELPADLTGFEVAEASWPNWIIPPEDGHHEDWVHAKLAPDRWDFDRYLSNAEHIFVRGHFEYEDVFGALYCRHFCLRRSAGREQEDKAQEWGGRRYNYDECIRSRLTAPERFLRNVVWPFIKHGFKRV